MKTKKINFNYLDQPFNLKEALNKLILGLSKAFKRRLTVYGIPEIFNTDQGSQYIGESLTGLLKAHDIAISMDGF